MRRPSTALRSRHLGPGAPCVPAPHALAVAPWRRAIGVALLGLSAAAVAFRIAADPSGGWGLHLGVGLLYLALTIPRLAQPVALLRRDGLLLPRWPLPSRHVPWDDLGPLLVPAAPRPPLGAAAPLPPLRRAGARDAQAFLRHARVRWSAAVFGD